MPSQGPEFADISEDTVTSFRVAKQWCNSDRINSVDFSSTGDTLIVAHSSDEISVYDCDKSEQVNTIPVRKYGVEIARYAPQPNQLIHTSTKIDHSIRHMAEDPSLNTFKYLHYYRGHTDRVMTLCMSPTEDKFISGSLDRTLRLWKLGRVDCIGIMNLSCRPIAAFDPTGKVFAVGINSACIKLYEVKNFERGPFITFHMEPEANGEWIDLKFSPDGRVIMINTNGSVIRLIDAFTGKPLQTITGTICSFFCEYGSCLIHRILF